MATQDLRLPVRFTQEDQAPDGLAVLREGEDFTVIPSHPKGCPCCVARNPAGVALAKLLQDRARGRVAFFKGVAAVTRTPAGREMLFEALRTDPVVSACFRLEE